MLPSHLKDVIHQGWPEYPNECPSGLKEFWNFSEDLSVENDLSIKIDSSLLALGKSIYYEIAEL